MHDTETTLWEPTRAAGLARLADFAASAGRHYADQRNYDLGPDDRTNVSTLSPYIRHRLVTEAEVARAAIDAHSARGGRAVLAGGRLADVLEGLARTPARGLEVLSGRGPGGPEVSGTRSDLARAVRSGHCRSVGDRLLRRLGAGAGRGRLPPQSRADVVRLDLDLHPGTALGAWGRLLPPAPPLRVPGVEHPLLALGGRHSDSRQDVPGDRREHQQVHQRSVQAQGTPGHRPPDGRRPQTARRRAVVQGRPG